MKDSAAIDFYALWINWWNETWVLTRLTLNDPSWPQTQVFIQKSFLSFDKLSPVAKMVMLTTSILCGFVPLLVIVTCYVLLATMVLKHTEKMRQDHHKELNGLKESIVKNEENSNIANRSAQKSGIDSAMQRATQSKNRIYKSTIW